MIKINDYRRFILPIVIIICFCGWLFCYFSISPVTTVILVRHGDRDPTGNDLNGLGLARAQELARVLDECPITTIYASNVSRTQQTAQPLATQLGLTLQIYDPANLQALTDEIKSQHTGEIVLVVGHSDSVSPTIELLGISPPPSLIPGNEFDHLYIVTFGRRTTTRMLKMEYGVNTP